MKEPAPTPAVDPRRFPLWLRTLSASSPGTDALEDRIRLVLKQNPLRIQEAWTFVDSRLPYNEGELTVIRTETPEDPDVSLARTTLQALSHPDTVSAQLNAWTKVNRRTILRVPFLARVGAGLVPDPMDAARAALRFFSGYSDPFELITTEGQLIYRNSIIIYLSHIHHKPVPPLSTWYWPLQADVVIEELLSRAGGRSHLESLVRGQLPVMEQQAVARFEQADIYQHMGFTPSMVGRYIDERITRMSRGGIRPFSNSMANEIVEPFLRGDFTKVVEFAGREIRDAIFKERVDQEADRHVEQNASKKRTEESGTPRSETHTPNHQPLLSALRRPLQDLVQVLSNHLQAQRAVAAPGRLTQAA